MWTITLHSTGYQVRLIQSGNLGSITQSNGHTINVSVARNTSGGAEVSGSDKIKFSDSYIWTLSFKGRNVRGYFFLPPHRQVFGNMPVSYLASVNSPYGKSTQFSYDFLTPPHISFGNQNCDEFFPRYTLYRINQYTESGPGMPTSVWKYSYAPLETTISGPIKTRQLIFLPNGDGAAKCPNITALQSQKHVTNHLSSLVAFVSAAQTENRYVIGDANIESEWVKDAKSGNSISYVHYEYTHGSTIKKQSELRPFYPWGTLIENVTQPEITNITYGTSPKSSDLISDSYKYNRNGLVASEIIGALNGLSQTINMSYFNKLYTDSNGIDHLLIAPTRITTLGADGIVDSSSSVINDDGYMTSTTHNGVEMLYTYDPNGNIATKTNALGGTSSYSDYVSGFAQTQSDALGHISTYKVNIDGTIASYTDPDGSKSEFQYDYLGRITKVTMPNSDIYSNVYSLVNGEQVTTITHGKAVQTTTYNAFGKPESTTVTAPDITSYTQTNQYDALGRKVFTSYPGDTLGTAVTYDGLGRVTETDWPVSGPGEKGKYQTTTTYPSWGQIQHTDANGHEMDTTNYIVGSWDNSLGPVDTVIPLSDGNSQETIISRDAMGRMKSVSQGYTGSPSQTRTYHYNDHFWVSEVDNPETGESQFSYDAIGEVISSTVGNSSSTKNTYDKIGELTSTTFPDGQVNSFTYTGTGKKKTAKEVNPSNSTMNNTWSFTYNSLDKIETATLEFPNQSNAPSFEFQYGYNARGFIDSATYPDKTVVNYAPDSLGRPTQASGWASDVLYMSDGHEKSFTDASGFSTAYTLNARHMVQGIDFSNPSNMLSSEAEVKLSYQYDGNTNVTQVTDTRPNHNKSYGYNDANWLISGTVDGQKVDVQYDSLGNITEKSYGSDDNDSVLNYVYDNQNRLASVSGHVVGALTGDITNTNPTDINDTQFTYDDYGNVTSRDGTGNTFTYNDASELTHAMGTNPATGKGFNFQYSYDAMGNRVAVQDLNASTLHYEFYNAKQKLLYKANADSTGNTVTDYIYLNGRKIAESTHSSDNAGSTESSTFFHSDFQDSVVLETKSDGSIVDTNGLSGQGYLPYGSELNPGIYKDTLTGNIGEHIGFINKPYNSDTGLSYFGARYYDPLVGRFMGIDPKGFDQSRPMTFSRYAYAADNPLRYKDPDGKDWVEEAEYNISVDLDALGPEFGGLEHLGEEAIVGGEKLVGKAKQAYSDFVKDSVEETKLSKADVVTNSENKVSVHHIATNKNFKSPVRGGPWSPRFEKIFSNAGLGLDDDINKVAVLGHKGPHPQEYHQYVYDQLNAAVHGLKPNTEQYHNAVSGTLKRLSEEAKTQGNYVNNMLRKK